MNNFKEWIGKSLLMRLKYNDEERNIREAYIKNLELLCIQQNTSVDRIRVLRLIKNGFKIFPEELIEFVEDYIDAEIWSSDSYYAELGLNKSFLFKIVNNQRILHGPYELTKDEKGNYIEQQWDNGRLVSTKRKGQRLIFDNVNITEPLYDGCKMHICVVPQGFSKVA